MFWSHSKHTASGDLSSSGMSRSLAWQLFTDVSRQPICLIFNDQAVQNYLTLQDGTSCLETSVTTNPHNIPEEWRSHWHRVAITKNNTLVLFREAIAVCCTDNTKQIQCVGIICYCQSRSRWGDNIKMDVQEVGCRGIDWIDLAQDRDRWRALVNAVWTIGFHKMRGISWLAENRLASQEGFFWMEWVSDWVSK